jgi:putative tricarboxylic transport membrane protein
MFVCLGAYADENSLLSVGVMLGCGLVGYWMEDNDFPVVPCVLGIVMGRIVEENLMTSLSMVQGDITRFFERPVSSGLALITLIIWLWPLLSMLGDVAPNQ